VSEKNNSYGVLGVKERLNQVKAEIQIISGPTGTQTIIKF
jgi:signal transduction histidine kinase